MAGRNDFILNVNEALESIDSSDDVNVGQTNTQESSGSMFKSSSHHMQAEQKPEKKTVMGGFGMSDFLVAGSNNDSILKQGVNSLPSTDQTKEQDIPNLINTDSLPKENSVDQNPSQEILQDQQESVPTSLPPIISINGSFVEPSTSHDSSDLENKATSDQSISKNAGDIITITPQQLADDDGNASTSSSLSESESLDSPVDTGSFSMPTISVLGNDKPLLDQQTGQSTTNSETNTQSQSTSSNQFTIDLSLVEEKPKTQEELAIEKAKLEEEKKKKEEENKSILTEIAQKGITITAPVENKHDLDLFKKIGNKRSNMRRIVLASGSLFTLLLLGGIGFWQKDNIISGINSASESMQLSQRIDGLLLSFSTLTDTFKSGSIKEDLHLDNKVLIGSGNRQVAFKDKTNEVVDDMKNLADSRGITGTNLSGKVISGVNNVITGTVNLSNIVASNTGVINSGSIINIGQPGAISGNSIGTGLNPNDIKQVSVLQNETGIAKVSSGQDGSVDSPVYVDSKPVLSPSQVAVVPNNPSNDQVHASANTENVSVDYTILRNSLEYNNSINDIKNMNIEQSTKNKYMIEINILMFKLKKGAINIAEFNKRFDDIKAKMLKSQKISGN